MPPGLTIGRSKGQSHQITDPACWSLSRVSLVEVRNSFGSLGRNDQALECLDQSVENLQKSNRAEMLENAKNDLIHSC